MTQEEKAKRYDGALHAAKAWHNTFINTKEDKNLKQLLETIFPELAESDDERIRKWLVGTIKQIPDSSIEWETISKSDVLAWLEKQGQQPKKTSIWKHWKDGIAGGGDGEQIYLIKTGNIYAISSCLGCECDYIELSELDNLMLEKQGEQKPIDEAEPKFHEGDWIVKENIVYHIDKISGVYLTLSTLDGTALVYHKSVLDNDNDKIHLWTIKDAKTGDVLVSSSRKPFIFKGFFDNDPIAYGGLVADDSFWPASNSNWTTVYCKPATKEQRDILFQKMKEAGYEWDANKKELKKFHVIDEGKAEMDYCFTKMMNGEKVSSAWSEEEYNGEDYGIDSLYHAQRILEKTLGKVDGYQSDDGILEHKCAITTVKKLCEQKPKWSDDDEQYLLVCKNALRKYQVSDKWDAEIISKWLEDKLKQGEQKPKWTEEDEAHLHSITTHLGQWIERHPNTCGADIQCENLAWLESLKQRMEGSK